MPETELETVGTVLEPMLVLGPGTEPEMAGTVLGLVLGRGAKKEPETELGMVLERLPELVPEPWPGTPPKTTLWLEMEAEAEQGNKYSGLHPWTKVL